MRDWVGGIRVWDHLPHRQDFQPLVRRFVQLSEESPMSKRARKRRARKGNGANHGHRPNA